MTTPEIVPMIIPTVMIPLTLVSVGLSVVASFIAALFGIQLKLEGPKKLLEVLLKPKILATAFALNALIMGGIYGWKWWKNYPRLISTIESEMSQRSKNSTFLYSDLPTVATNFKSKVSGGSGSIKGIEQLWKMETGAGSEFDAELHEAITEIPAPSPELAGKVVDVIEKGYYLNEKLIRHAKVVVGK